MLLTSAVAGDGGGHGSRIGRGCPPDALLQAKGKANSSAPLFVEMNRIGTANPDLDLSTGAELGVLRLARQSQHPIKTHRRHGDRGLVVVSPVARVLSGQRFIERRNGRVPVKASVLLLL